MKYALSILTLFFITSLHAQDFIPPSEGEYDTSYVNTIILTNGELIIEDALTIEGLGLDRLTIDANSQSRV